MSTKTTIAGGVLILAGGLGLAVYANTNISALQNAKATTVTKYVALSSKALKEGDLKGAEKFAQKALVADPKNKAALGSYKAVTLAACPKATATPTTPAANTTAPAAVPAQAEAPAAEAEDEMGCI